MSALSRHTPAAAHQREPIPGRESEMVRNAAGGYVFAKDLWTRLQDFIVLGTEGGTYYADEKTHTFRNIAVVTEAVRTDGPRAVSLAVEISTARPARAPKNHPALYVVATALALGDLETRRAAADAVPRVARTTDHLSHLFGYFKSMAAAGGGAGLRSSPVIRRAWTNWFRSGTPDRVAYQILKAGQRKTGDGESFRPGDLLRIARPTPRSEVEDALFGLATGRKSAMDVSGHLSNAKAYYEAQLADTPAKAVRAINAYHVPWEFLPSAVLSAPDVWEALVPHLGLTALIRNLARMTTLGVLGPFRPANAIVARRLSDQSELHAARVHPFDLMLALTVYTSGTAQPDPRAPRRSWVPVPEIVSALNRAYALSFGVCSQTSGRLVLAVDASGSMSYPVTHGGSTLGSCYHISSAIAQVLMRTWSSAWPLNFHGSVSPSRLTSDMPLSDVFRLPHGGGATDMAAPIEWAISNKIVADGFVFLTDGETWAGQRHVSHVLADYRRKLNPAARVVVASMAANGYSVGDPRDPGVLNIAGFDSTLPTLIGGFVRPSGTAPGDR